VNGTGNPGGASLTRTSTSHVPSGFVLPVNAFAGDTNVKEVTIAIATNICVFKFYTRLNFHDFAPVGIAAISAASGCCCLRTALKSTSSTALFKHVGHDSPQPVTESFSRG
jgi:uncharacterized membrane protein YdfJ with MMPL/SSD domain